MTITVAGQSFRSARNAAAHIGVTPSQFKHLRKVGRLDMATGDVLPVPHDYDWSVSLKPYVEDPRCDLHLMPYDLAVGDLQEIWTAISNGGSDYMIARNYLHVPHDVIGRVRCLTVGDLVSFARPPWPQLGRVGGINGALTVTV